MSRRILDYRIPEDLAILKKISTPVTSEDNIKEIVTALVGTLGNSKTGVGLAAPQIGINKRVIVINVQEIVNLVMINPRIVSAMGRIKFDEICLSLPGIEVRKTRKQFIKVKFLNEKLEEKEMQLSGFKAVIIQHELDHLDGRLIQ